jgi:hypothetical protein
MAEKLVLGEMNSPEKLKAWLEATGRRWLVLDSVALVNAVSWPAGVLAFQSILSDYEAYRSSQESGRKALVQGRPVPVMKSDVLEADEMDAVIRHLVAQLKKLDPDWTL